MAEESLTHTYKLESSSFNINGQAEFNTDTKNQYSIINHDTPLDRDKIEMLEKLFSLVAEFEKHYTGVTKIAINKIT